jgi:hypothetical protein
MVEMAAFLLCDRAERDDVTGKWTLHGVFDVVWAERFPAVHDRLDAYLRLRLTGSHQEGAAEVSFACRPPSGAVQQAEARSLAVSALGTADAICRFEGLSFEAPGTYVFEARVNGEVAGSTMLTVQQARAAAESLH